MIPTWYRLLSECALCIYHFKLRSDDVFQTVSDLNFKTVLLNLNEGMSDLISDNKD